MRPNEEATTEERPAGGASLWEWARVLAVAATVAWPTARLGGFLAGTRGETAVLVAALLTLHLLAPLPGGRARPHPAGWLPLPFLLYAAANAAWVAPEPWLGWMDWAGWAAAAALYWVVLNGIRSPRCRQALVGGLILIGSGSSLAALYQRFERPDWLPLGRTQAAQFIGRSSGTFGIPNSLGGLAILLLPAAAVLAFNARVRVWLRVTGAAGLGLLSIALFLTISRGAWISLALALASVPLLSGRGRLARRLAAAAGIGLAAAAVAAGLCAANPAVRARIRSLYTDMGEKSRPILWRGALGIGREHPWFGGGAGSFNLLFEPFRPIGFQDEPVWAHNDYLNTLADYGGVGLVLLTGAAAVTVGMCRRRREPGAEAPQRRRRVNPAGWRAALGTGLLAFSLQLFVDFHFKLPALAFAFAAVAGVVVAESWRSDGPDGGSESVSGIGGRRLRFANVAVAATVVAGVVLWIRPRFEAEGIRWLARDRINKLALQGADLSRQPTEMEGLRSALATAVRIDPENGQAWSDLAYANSLLAFAEPGRTHDLGRIAQIAAERALALSPEVPEFWVRKGTGLDMQGRWPEAGEAISHALELAPVRVDLWYYQAFHLSLNADDPGAALAAADYCLSLDPGYRLAQVLRQRLATADSTSR